MEWNRNKIIFITCLGITSVGIFTVPFFLPNEAESLGMSGSTSLSDSQSGASLEELQAEQKTLSENMSLKNKRLIREIEKKIAVLAKKNLAGYAMKKFENPSPETIKKLENAYIEMQKEHPKSDISPRFLIRLGNEIEKKAVILDADEEFLSYAYILLALKKTGENMETLDAKRQKEIDTAFNEIEKNPLAFSATKEEVQDAEEVFALVNKNSWSTVDVGEMKREIRTEGIGPNTRFFKAYRLARFRLAKYKKSIEIGSNLVHTKQKYPLSCESNSIKDLLNYYRSISGKAAIDEETVILMLPSHTEDPKSTKINNKTVRIWGDPNREFVGKITGMQSINPNKFSGYGIHADGVLPFLKNALKPLSLSVEKNTFTEANILESLQKGNPVVFWYVAGSAGKVTAPSVNWITEDGKEVTGYIGEHTGIIVGANIDNEGNIKTLKFYEGREESLKEASWEDMYREAKWLDTALFVKPI